MRRWKISHLRDMIFDGDTIWLVVGHSRMTKLIKFNPDNDRVIDITKPDWKNSTAAYRAEVTALGPVSDREGFLVQDHRYTYSDAVPESFSYWHKELGRLVVDMRDLCLEAFDRTIVTLRATCDAISVSGDRYILVDATRGKTRLRGWPVAWQVNVYTPADTEEVRRVRTLTLPVTHWQCCATTNGISAGNTFVDFDAHPTAAHPGRFILDVLGDRRLERDSPDDGTGRKLYLDDRRFKFTNNVHDARFALDGMTAFVWGARELVQFDLD